MEPRGGAIVWLVPAMAWVFSYLPTTTYREHEFHPINTTTLQQEYDFVVVGAGSAGSVVASRLSEDPEVEVLLLEAGGQETVLSEVPGLSANLQLTALDWQYRAEPSATTCLAMVDNRCNLPRGRVLGGSSAINYMLYVRGNRRDYDGWEARGNPGWGYQHLLPYFTLTEDNTDPDVSQEYHGKGGLMTVGRAPWSTPLASAFLEGGRELGYPTADCNAARQTGFMAPHGTLRRGARCSNAKAFLRPARLRPNLHVALGAFVTRVLIDPATRRAEGVAYDRGEGKKEEEEGRVVAARREVVLAAGAINTPQLLMLSGVGPARHLASLGIPVVADLPVGRNLQDHVAAGVMFTVEDPVSLMFSRIYSLPALLRYSLFGSGPLTTLGGVEGVGFVNTRYANASDDWPDAQLQFVAGSHASDGGAHLRHALGLREEYWRDFYSHLAGRDHYTVQVKLARPRSRGYVELRSADPYQHPKIVTNYLKEREDVAVLLEGLKVAFDLANTTALRRYGSRLFDRPVPGCKHLTHGSNVYWECYVRHLTFTIYHYCGTAKMGPAQDPTSVVDPELRVKGVSGLRVVDASIFPTITTGNTNAPTTMVAEKASHMIRSHWHRVVRRRPPAAAARTTTTTTPTLGRHTATTTTDVHHYYEL
ncbi:glucose dehydrogenase [FAD, quinone]-like isoform X2 [Panulirus ornatus]|uniref:glucose dehydrogenase [FAD, quinone]-like isoform X2 n=1 Tax=Panulirus ornatus TaxID=150431 RepID=UPI003A866A88